MMPVYLPIIELIVLGVVMAHLQSVVRTLKEDRFLYLRNGFFFYALIRVWCLILSVAVSDIDLFHKLFFIPSVVFDITALLIFYYGVDVENLLCEDEFRLKEQLSTYKKIGVFLGVLLLASWVFLFKSSTDTGFRTLQLIWELIKVVMVIRLVLNLRDYRIFTFLLIAMSFIAEVFFIKDNYLPLYLQDLFFSGGILIFVYRSRDEFLGTLKSMHEEQKKQVEKKLELLQYITRSVNSTMSQQEVLEILSNGMMTTLGASSCAIYLFDESSDKLEARVVNGVFPPNYPVDKNVVSGRKHLQDYILREKINPGEGIVGKTLERQETIWFKQPGDCEDFEDSIPDILEVKTAIYIPLIAADNALGVMAAVNREDKKSFTEEDVGLFKTLAEQGAISIENTKLQTEVLSNKLVQQDLEIAKEIQLKLLPKQLPVIPGFSIGGYYKAAKEVGGDYYDVIWDGKNRLGIIVADVSGKGVPGSLVMAMARSVIRSQIISTQSSAEILQRTNMLLYPDIPRGMFITACLAILDIDNKTLDISSAGHNPMALYRKDTNEVIWNWMEGLALGLDEGELFNEIVNSKSIPLKDEDLFLIYSDGVNEAFNEKKDFFGYERIERVLMSYGNEDGKVFIQKLDKEIKRFVGNAEQSDDITAVAVKIKAGS